MVHTCVDFGIHTTLTCKTSTFVSCTCGCMLPRTNAASELPNQTEMRQLMQLLGFRHLTTRRTGGGWRAGGYTVKIRASSELYNKIGALRLDSTHLVQALSRAIVLVLGFSEGRTWSERLHGKPREYRPNAASNPDARSIHRESSFAA